MRIKLCLLGYGLFNCHDVLRGDTLRCDVTQTRKREPKTTVLGKSQTAHSDHSVGYVYICVYVRLQNVSGKHMATLYYSSKSKSW